MAAPKTQQEVEQAEQDELTRRLTDYASFFAPGTVGARILGYLKESLDGHTYRPGMDRDESLWREGRRSVYRAIIAAVGEGQQAIEHLKEEPKQTTAIVEPNPLSRPVDDTE